MAEGYDTGKSGTKGKIQQHHFSSDQKHAKTVKDKILSAELENTD